MNRGLRIGRVAGVEVAVDWSLIIIFTLVTMGLGVGVFPSWHPEWTQPFVWLTALAAATLLFVSVWVHEMSHALIGRIGGVHIRRITLFVFGGMAHMENEPGSWKAEFAMAAAGPIVSLLIGFVCLYFAGVRFGNEIVDEAQVRQVLATLNAVPTVLLWLGSINVALGLFNLVPGFPLDGGRVVRAIAWAITGNLERATRFAAALGQLFGWLLIIAGFAMMFGAHLPILGYGFVNGVWLAMIGWFLNSAAHRSYQQLVVGSALRHFAVGRLMRTSLRRVTPETTVDTLVARDVMQSGQRRFPVESDGRFVGIVDIADLRRVERSRWDSTPLSEIMTPAQRLQSVSTSESAITAAKLLSDSDAPDVPVVQNDRLLGLVGREDLVKWLSLGTAESSTAHS